MMVFLAVLHVLACLCIVAVVLVQKGKGPESGTGMGTGSAIFGVRGTATVLTRTTGVLAAVFFLTSLSLTILAQRQSASVLERVPEASGQVGKGLLEEEKGSKQEVPPQSPVEKIPD